MAVWYNAPFATTRATQLAPPITKMDRILEFTSQHTLLVAFLLISFFVLVFSEMRRKASGMVSIDPSAAVAMINNDGIVLDLRNTETFSKGHIVNAKNIPYDEFDAQSNKVQRWINKPVIAVCDTGITSTKAVDALRKSGFESIYSLKGGMTAWGGAGLPVVAVKKTKSKN